MGSFSNVFSQRICFRVVRVIPTVNETANQRGWAWPTARPNQKDSRVFFDNKLADGKTKREALRALKTRIAWYIHSPLSRRGWHTVIPSKTKGLSPSSKRWSTLVWGY